MAERPLRAAIVGTGFMGSVHAQAVKAAGHELVGFAGSSRVKAEQTAARLGGRAFDSVDALADAPDVDVVHVCTPNHVHLTHALQALQSGKHVICEKPLATTSDDAETLVRIAEQMGVAGFVPFVYRFYPAIQEMRGRISRGDSGPIHLMHGSYLQDWLASASAENWRVQADVGGASRTFADIGVHWFDLLEYVSGHRVSRVFAKMDTVYPSRAGSTVSTEDAVYVVFETDRGATGSFLASQVSLGRKNRILLEIDGQDAAFSFDHQAVNQLWIGGASANTVLETGPETLHSPEALEVQKVPSGHPQGYRDAFEAFVANSYQTIAGDQVSIQLPTFSDGLRAVRLTDAVVESARQSAWVSVVEHAPRSMVQAKA